MSTYNILHTSLICPRCGVAVDATIDCHFGYTAEMADLQIGDRYPWQPGKQPQNGGRPEHGTVNCEGYMECVHCGKDAFLRVIVRNDVIIGVEPDAQRLGHIPD
ncbi:hypothetical protein [Pedosphaera parvula]|uniref:hypothetical protein n=1 Tax=Pedosphaera parvula TaxID=1032527 RepID=UPI0002D94937|nr:hypothetical protein [Pedosphaera parvula]